MEERRRFIRVPVSLSIRFRGLDDFNDYIQGNVKDLSHGGLFLRTTVTKPMGSQVLIQIPDGAGGFHTIKGLVRCVTKPGQGALEPGMGIEFVSVDEALQQLIQEVISRHQAPG